MGVTLGFSSGNSGRVRRRSEKDSLTSFSDQVPPCSSPDTLRWSAVPWLSAEQIASRLPAERGDIAGQLNVRTAGIRASSSGHCRQAAPSPIEADPRTSRLPW